MATFPTLTGAGTFAFFPLGLVHGFNAVQDHYASGHIGTHERWSRPRRSGLLSGRVLSEVNVHKVMGFIRDDIKGGANPFDWTNNSADVWDAGVAPTLGQSAGGALGGRTYYVVFTWSDGSSETRESPEASYAVDANKYLTVTVPTFPTAVTEARIYIGTVTGTLYYSGKLTTDGGTWTEDDASTTVNGNSAAAQKVLNVAATANFQVGSTVVIDASGAREEFRIIASIQAGTSLTMVGDLEYEHTAVQTDPVATVVGSSSQSAPPTDNDFVETISMVLDETAPSPVPYRVGPGVWALDIFVIEVF